MRGARIGLWKDAEARAAVGVADAGVPLIGRDMR